MAVKNNGTHKNNYNYKDIYQLPQLMDQLHFSQGDFKADGAINYHVNFNKMGKYSLVNRRKGKQPK